MSRTVKRDSRDRWLASKRRRANAEADRKARLRQLQWDELLGDLMSDITASRVYQDATD